VHIPINNVSRSGTRICQSRQAYQAEASAAAGAAETVELMRNPIQSVPNGRHAFSMPRSASSSLLARRGRISLNWGIEFGFGNIYNYLKHTVVFEQSEMEKR